MQPSGEGFKEGLQPSLFPILQIYAALKSSFVAILPGLLRSSTIPSQMNQMIWLKPKTPINRSVNPGIMEMMPSVLTNKLK